MPKISLIPENEPPSKQPKKKATIWRRSWTIKLIKSPYAPVVLTLFALFLACACVVVGAKAEEWWLKEKVVTVPAIGVRTVKAAGMWEINPATMTTEQYIRFIFGKEAPTALAVAKAESGLRCDAQNVNKHTNSIDIGLFQVNSVHLRKGWKIADLLDCKANIQYAKEIKDSSGWCPWVAYKKLFPSKCN
jgi:hypothetical protein